MSEDGMIKVRCKHYINSKNRTNCPLVCYKIGVDAKQNCVDNFEVDWVKFIIYSKHLINL